jgi:diphthine methyl ester acylhydrolase
VYTQYIESACIGIGQPSDKLSLPLLFVWNVDDESISLFDMRFLSQRTPMFKTDNLGGGIWRMKWHPYDQNRMLVAAMHAGCRVLNFYGEPDGSHDPFSADTPKLVTDKCTKAFTEHESMAYGADWLVCQHPTQNGYFEAAARYVAFHPGR